MVKSRIPLPRFRAFAIAAMAIVTAALAILLSDDPKRFTSRPRA